MSKQESGHDTGILRSDMNELAQAAADATRRALVAEAKLAALEAQIATLVVEVVRLKDLLELEG